MHDPGHEGDVAVPALPYRATNQGRTAQAGRGQSHLQASKRIRQAAHVLPWDRIVLSKGRNGLIEGTKSSHRRDRIVPCTYRNNKTEEKTNAREDLEYQRPTEQEVIDYLTDRGAGDLAPTLGPAFWNYYEANGWMVNGTPIAKWKPKANQWINTERNKQSNDRRKGFNAQNFTPDGLRDFIDNR